MMSQDNLIKIMFVCEIIFYLVFHFIMKPKSNDLSRKSPKICRDYQHISHDPLTHRHQLLKRILDRIQKNCEVEGKEFRDEFDIFMRGWFDVIPNKSNKNLVSREKSEMPFSFLDSVDRQSVEIFFSWAFFDKQWYHLETWEIKEIAVMFKMLENRGITFQREKDMPSRDFTFIPRCMTLEKSNSIHRPLAFYFFLGWIRILGYLILLMFGYRRYTIQCESGNHMTYWFRDSRDISKHQTDETILFQHGISPGGLANYIPFIVYCLNQINRSVLIPETHSITCSLSFHALDEEEMVDAVQKALRRHKKLKNGLYIVSHSFGTFQSTWILKAKEIRPLIRKVVLIDPVSILLSFPDVLSNFLYSNRNKKDRMNWKQRLNMEMVRLLASSELFIEDYLRRKFAWFNSELWLEDIPCDTHIFLAEDDVILNACKIQRELDRHLVGSARKSIFYTVWNNIRHAEVLFKPRLLNQVKQALETSTERRKRD